MSRLARLWSTFLDWCNPDRVTCRFANLTDDEETSR